MTIKLYKKIKNKLHYWETWSQSLKAAAVHYGVVGDKGDGRIIDAQNCVEIRKIINKKIQDKIDEGYEEILDEDHYVLQIEYVIDGFGTEEDLAKRRRLQDRMNELLWWHGLGECDGGSSGSDTMEVCCFVVDFKLAKEMIEKDLENTEFADYSRIYEE